jgi:hypothetical protein
VNSELEKANLATFDTQIEANLGPDAKPIDFTDDGDLETPDFKTYTDDADGTKQPENAGSQQETRCRCVQQTPWS